MKAFAVRAENQLASLALGGIMLLPLAEIVSRKFLSAAIPGSGAIAAVLTLWLGMLGAAIAARDGKLLTLATGEFLPEGPIKAVAHIISGTIGAMIATIFATGGIALVRSDRLAGDIVTAGLPTWVADLALPIGFGLIAVRLVCHASPRWCGR
jgi:C4-dicarboxylate transporter, DctM subunit